MSEKKLNIFHLYDVVLTAVFIQLMANVGIPQDAAYVATAQVNFTIMRE